MAFGLTAAQVALGGSVLGAVAGGQDGQATQTKEPWSPSQEWLKSLLTGGQELQKKYEAQPFNALQQQAYGNLFSDIDSFRNTTAPGLLNWANGAMTGPGYLRQQLAAPGAGGYGPRTQPQGGLLGAPPQQQAGPFATAPAQPQAGGYGQALQQAFAPPAAATAPPAAATPPGPQNFDDWMKQTSEADRVKAMLGGNRPSFLAGKSMFDAAPW